MEKPDKRREDRGKEYDLPEESSGGGRRVVWFKDAGWIEVEDADEEFGV